MDRYLIVAVEEISKIEITDQGTIMLTLALGTRIEHALRVVREPGKMCAIFLAQMSLDEGSLFTIVYL